MSEEIKKVAFIGLGKMGSGMAQNILKAGFNLAVYDLVQSKMKALIAAIFSLGEASFGKRATICKAMRSIKAS